jgi:hypothetical protein
MSVNAKATTIFGFLIILVIATALAPTLFSSANLSGSGAPTWVVTITPIVVAAIFILFLWKAGMMGTK